MDQLTDEQIMFARHCVSQWLTIYRATDAGKRNWGSDGDTPTPADADHSALLYRLLSGEEALPKPPPLSYSYPNYTLGSGEEYKAYDAEIHFVNGTCYIDQSEWEIVKDNEKISAIQTLVPAAKNGIILRWPENGDYYLLFDKDDGKWMKKIYAI